MSRPTQIVQLKAYGDFTIAVSSLMRVSGNDWSIIAGEHLRPLAEALDWANECSFLATGEPGVPSLFDVRKNGLVAALRSALFIRRSLKRAAHGRLLFDQVTLREQYLAGGLPTIGLPHAPNIYLAYEELLGPGKGVRVENLAGRPRSVVVFPASRIAAKEIPTGIVKNLLAAAERAGIRAEVVLLEGERPELVESGLACRVIEKSFPALVAAIGACDAVLSADSLPAHLAEHMNIPVYVVTPRANEYWLPRSTYEHGRWATFAGGQAAIGVENFLRDIG